MRSDSWFSHLVDILLVTHFAFVLFVVFGLILILLGKLRRWNWVRNPWFRIAHLSAIGIVVLESWLSIVCPFTRWEMELRQQAGDSGYSGSFIAHWLDRLLYYQAPEWVFTVCYTVFGAIVIASWFWVRPRGFRRKRAHDAN
ncbi:MAG: DUF2784 domain-containing protein [Acidiferrobacterales bacterium]